MDDCREQPRVEDLSGSSRAARWSREKFDAVPETSEFADHLGACAFFASSLMAGPRSSYRMPWWGSSNLDAQPVDDCADRLGIPSRGTSRR
jgi:hypothetical protein